MQFSHAHMKAGVCPPCNSQPRELLGSWWGWLKWPHIQQLIGSRVWWELPGVLFAFERTPRILGLPLLQWREHSSGKLSHGWKMLRRKLGQQSSSRVQRRSEDAVIANLIATTCKAQTNTFTKCCHYGLFCALESDLAVNGEWHLSPQQKQFALWRMHWVMSVSTGGGKGGWRDPVLLPLCSIS